MRFAYQELVEKQTILSAILIAGIFVTASLPLAKIFNRTLFLQLRKQSCPHIEFSLSLAANFLLN